MKNKLAELIEKLKLTPKQRLWLYGVVTALIPVFGVTKWIDPQLVGPIVTLLGAVLATSATGTATVTLAGQLRDGTVKK